MRTAFLVDAPILYGVIVLVELISGSQPLGAFGNTPHPYWIPILTLAAAQGTVAGLFAVLMGVSIQIFGLTLAQGLDAAIGTLVSNPASTLYFLGGAFVIGEIHDVHASRFRYLQKLLSRESSKGAQLQYEREVLLAANKRLRQRIEEEPHQLAELFDSTARLQRSPNEEIYNVLLETVRSNCGATKASVIQPDGDGWKLRASVGWTDDEQEERLAALLRSPLVLLASREHRGVQAFEIGVKLKAFDPFYVMPISRPDGTLRALVSLDEMPAQQMSPGVAAVFFGIGEWADASLALATSENETPVQTRAARAGIATPEELGERLRLEYHRAERYGGSLSMACLYVPEWRHHSQAAQRELDRVVLSQLAEVLGSESLYSFGVPGCYVVVQHGLALEQSGQPPKNAARAWARAIDHSHPGLELDWLAVGPSTPDPHSLLAAMAQYFQENAGRGDGRVLDSVRMPMPGAIGDLDTLLRRLPLEAALAKDTGDACFVSIIRSDDDDGPFELGIIYPAVEALRPTDGVFMTTPNVLVVLLPNSEGVDAEVATTRFLEAVRAGEARQKFANRTVDVALMDVQQVAADPLRVLDIDGGVR